MRLGPVVSLLSSAAVLGLSCSRETPPPPPPPTVAEPVWEVVWSTPSASGQARLEQRKAAEACSLVCVIGGAAPAWTAEGCVASSTDLRFVAEDCRTAVVMYPTPDELEKGRLVLLRIFRNGVADAAVNDGDLKVGATAGRGRWLGGVNGELGNKPRYSADGRAVEFQLVTSAGRVGQRLLLEADEKTTGQGAAPLLYTYVDEKGATQFVDSLEQVPARYRSTATVVKSDVSVVAADQSKPSVRPTAPTGTGSLFNEQPSRPAAQPSSLEKNLSPNPLGGERQLSELMIRDTQLKRYVPTPSVPGEGHGAGLDIRYGPYGRYFVPHGDHPVAPGSSCGGPNAPCINSYQCCTQVCSGGSCM